MSTVIRNCFGLTLQRPPVKDEPSKICRALKAWLRSPNVFRTLFCNCLNCSSPAGIISLFDKLTKSDKLPKPNMAGLKKIFKEKKSFCRSMSAII